MNGTPTERLRRVAPFASLCIVSGLALTGCGSMPSSDATDPNSSSCSEYDDWGVSRDQASPRGRGVSPEDAVNTLTSRRAEVVDVRSEERRVALVDVRRDAVDGTYRVEQVADGWLVVGGKGCAAITGAPMRPADLSCGPAPADLQTDTYLTVCETDEGISDSIEYVGIDDQ